MSKKTKQIIYYGMVLIFIFIVPVLVFNYLQLHSLEKFYKRLGEDHRTCYQRAGRDGMDARWCEEIRDAAKLAYNESSRASNIPLLLLFMSPFVHVLFINIYELRKQVDKLKENINA